MKRIKGIYQTPVRATPAKVDMGCRNQETRSESVPEFVAYFYNFVRDDAAMVRLLDRALKERYGTSGTHG